MKIYRIPAIKFESMETTTDSQYIIQEFNQEFTIWEDPFGEFDCGEDSIHSGLEPCKSLKEVYTVLLQNQLIESTAKFINIENE